MLSEPSYSVTLLVRNQEKLVEVLRGASLLRDATVSPPVERDFQLTGQSRCCAVPRFDNIVIENVQIVEGSISDRDRLAAAFKGQEACICTAGNAKTTPEAFRRIFKGEEMPLKLLCRDSLEEHTRN